MDGLGIHAVIVETKILLPLRDIINVVISGLPQITPVLVFPILANTVPNVQSP
jgi:hypothetical protein